MQGTPPSPFAPNDGAPSPFAPTEASPFPSTGSSAVSPNAPAASPFAGAEHPGASPFPATMAGGEPDQDAGASPFLSTAAPSESPFPSSMEEQEPVSRGKKRKKERSYTWLQLSILAVIAFVLGLLVWMVMIKGGNPLGEGGSVTHDAAAPAVMIAGNAAHLT